MKEEGEDFLISPLLFNAIDSKLKSIYEFAKRPAVIVVNEHLYLQMQDEMLKNEPAHAFTKTMLPFGRNMYKGVELISSQVIETVDVF